MANVNDRRDSRQAPAPDGTDDPSLKGGAPGTPAPALEWTCHPVKRRPWVSVLVSMFIIVVVVVVYYTTMSKAFAVLAMVIMLASLAKFYFPTGYRLTPDGITVKTTTQTLHKQWSLYRSCYPDKNGILLSPFARPSRLESFRGIYVMFSGNRDEVTAYVEEHIGKSSNGAGHDPRETVP
ncbi:MAG: hypothetical protein AB1744_02820 [Candidatus Zixiibacteriota bacterium]